MRKLAERTGQSTSEIATTIEKIQSGTQDAVHSMESGVIEVNRGIQLAGEAGAAIVKITETTESVMRAVTDISLAINEQGQASKKIAQGIEEIAQSAEQNALSMRESAAVAQQLQILASDLQSSVSRFRT